MNIGGVFGEFPCVERRNVVVFGVLALGGDSDFAEKPGFLHRLAGPRAGIDEIRRAGGHKVHRDHGELHACAALNVDNVIGIGNAEDVTDVLIGMVKNSLEILAAVGVFKNAASCAVIVAEFFLSSFHNGRRQHGRPCIKIEYLHQRSLLLLTFHWKHIKYHKFIILPE